MKVEKIKKYSQNYLKDIIKKYPSVSSGRKNYDFHYNRLLKNLLLIKANKNLEKRNNFFKKFKFSNKKKYVYIEYKM